MTPTEILAWFLESYVFQEALKRGVDVAPAFISPTTANDQPTLTMSKGRELLAFEPNTSDQFEAFGSRLHGLLPASSLKEGANKGTNLAASFTGPVDTLVILAKGTPHLLGLTCAGGLVSLLQRFARRYPEGCYRHSQAARPEQWPAQSPGRGNEK